jgi:KaiC/GvpD/RAD55 family RecA-like ATPase
MRVSELKVLALLRYRENYLKYAPILKDNFFSVAETKDLFGFIGKYHKKYGDSNDNGKVPLSYLRIMAEDIKDEGRRNLIEEELIDQLQIKKRSDEFVEDLIRGFGQRALLKQSVMDAFDMLQGPEDTLDVEKIKTKVEQAMEIVVPSQPKVSFFDDVDNQIEQYENEPRILTGIRELDEHTKGGVPKGRLALVVAPPKRGKTLFLTNIGAKAVGQGEKVIDISLEINKREKSIRYAQCMLNRPYEYLREYPDTVKKVLNKYRKRGGELFIEEMIGVSPTIDDLEGLVRSYRLKFGMCVLDYLDLVSTKTAYKDERGGTKEVYTAARRWAIKMNFVLWSASQSNRGSLAKKVVSMEDVAEDIRKIAICDLGVFICQTPEEKEEDLARLFVGATRFGKRNPLFMVSSDPDCMKIKSIERRQKER